MRIHPLSRAVTLAVIGSGLSLPMLAHAEFVEDSKLDLNLRNFYFNRDFRDNATTAKPKAEEWAQGFLLNLQSGYTEGMVGFGVDAMGLLGVRLDSGGGRSGTGLLPVGNDGKADEEYSSAAANVKMQISKSNIKAGTAHRPRLPVVQASDIRLLPQVFEGFHGNMLEISGLNFNAGQLTGVKQRASTDREDMRLNGVGTAKGTDSFQFAGADYALTDTLKATYYYGELEDFYDQNAFGLLWTQPLSDGQVLSADLRYLDSGDSGDQFAGELDNEAYQMMLGYKIGAHSFAAAYQQMDGDSLFPYIAETDPWLVNYVQINNFAKAEEKSWQGRYILDFASYGIPGLSLMTRYVTGDDFNKVGGATGNSDGKEWERDTDIAYMFQSGSLKGMEIRWRNATYRTNATSGDLDENRLIVNYSLAIW
jgi:hypothetical protein